MKVFTTKSGGPWHPFTHHKRAIRKSFLRENRIFHQFAKVFSFESFPLYGIQQNHRRTQHTTTNLRDISSPAQAHPMMLSLKAWYKVNLIVYMTTCMPNNFPNNHKDFCVVSSPDQHFCVCPAALSKNRVWTC